METSKVKAQFFSMYLGQQILKACDGCSRVEIQPNDLKGISDSTYLLLRTVEQLTDEEKQIIADRMQWYPEDVIDWINGDCGHGDYENLYTWLPCLDILRALGILLSFTYINEQGKPETLQPDEIVSIGWAKIKND